MMGHRAHPLMGGFLAIRPSSSCLALPPVSEGQVGRLSSILAPGDKRLAGALILRQWRRCGNVP